MEGLTPQLWISPMPHSLLSSYFGNERESKHCEVKERVICIKSNGRGIGKIMGSCWIVYPRVKEVSSVWSVGSLFPLLFSSTSGSVINY